MKSWQADFTLNLKIFTDNELVVLAYDQNDSLLTSSAVNLNSSMICFSPVKYDSIFV